MLFEEHMIQHAGCEFYFVRVHGYETVIYFLKRFPRFFFSQVYLINHIDIWLDLQLEALKCLKLKMDSKRPTKRPTFILAALAHRVLPKCPIGQSALAVG